MLPPPVSGPSPAEREAQARPLARWLAFSESHAHGIYLGLGPSGAVFAPPQHGALVLGPPRCGKTAAIMVPNVLGSCGPVVAASTKPDLLHLTAKARALVGDCLLYDPSGTAPVPPGVQRVAWSPLQAAASWSGALSVAESMVLAARPGGDHGEAAHWNERATALLAVAFHAGALAGSRFRRVLASIDRRQPEDFHTPLARNDADGALNLLAGITATDGREQSGIWSTAAGVLAGYRGDAALASTEGRQLDARRFASEPSTLYVCAGSDEQRQAAALVAGLLRDVRAGAYARSAALRPEGLSAGPPLLLALDELANIAPLHNLPTLVSEGGSQGVVTLGCLQDLAQAAARWGRQADGFLSLFQAKVVFPGIGDVRTLETISKLGGETDVRHSSRTRSSPWAALAGQRAHSSRTDSTRRERRFPVEVIAQGHSGVVLHLDGVQPRWLSATPWFANAELREIVDQASRRERLSGAAERTPPGSGRHDGRSR
ncbi:MAG: type IV secretory system conjugative DNA transfer family protein [Acidimicrobiales bacterium]|jgi:type IV secretory pathway TraG/TraD family ATPase VirD4